MNVAPLGNDTYAVVLGDGDSSTKITYLKVEGGSIQETGVQDYGVSYGSVCAHPSYFSTNDIIVR